MTGATLAERITEMKPGVPVLHMSGYSCGVLDPELIRDGELAFIQKPFIAPALLEKVRAVLKAPPGADDSGLADESFPHEEFTLFLPASSVPGRRRR